MSEAYNKDLIRIAECAAENIDVNIKKGVFIATARVLCLKPLQK